MRFKEFNDEWKKVPAGEIFKHVTNKNHDGTLPILAVTQDQGVVCRDSLDMEIKTSAKSVKSYKIIDPGDFVISLRSFQGGIEYSNIKGICSPAYTILKPKLDIFDDFYKFYLKKEEFISRLNYAVIGIRDGKQISYKDFSEIKIPYTSVEEQEKISEYLDVIDAKIMLLKKKYGSYLDYKKYLLQNIFAQKLRFDGFEDEWKYEKLGKISSVKDGTHDSPKYVSEGYPLITSKNLLNGIIDFNNVNYISKEDYDSINKRSNVDKGDILFGMIGTIGNPVIVESDDFAIKNVALIKEKKGLLNSFLIHILETDIIKRQFYRLNAGGTQKFIALGLIKNLSVPLPSMDEQLKISEFLNLVTYKENMLKNQVLHMESFKKGLLQSLFI